MKNNLILVIAFLSASVLGLFVWAIIVERHVSDTGRQVASLTAQVAANNTTRQTAVNVQTSAAASSPDIAQANSYIIPADGTADFIDQVEKLAQSDNLAVTVNSVNVQSANNLSAAELEYLQLDVTVTGSWSHVYQFAAQVENLPYDISIGQAEFSDQTDDGTDKGSSVWQGAFALSVIKNISPDESH